jgi:hypothetical protein
LEFLHLTGCKLEVNNNNVQIIVPTTVKIQPAGSNTKELDHCTGYKLELNANGGYIVALSNPIMNLVQTPAVRKIDIGSGYWLVIGPDGGQIVKEGSK